VDVCFIGAVHIVELLDHSIEKFGVDDIPDRFIPTHLLRKSLKLGRSVLSLDIVKVGVFGKESSNEVVAALGYRQLSVWGPSQVQTCGLSSHNRMISLRRPPENLLTAGKYFPERKV
jgi:hypothetical protein